MIERFKFKSDIGLDGCYEIHHEYLLIRLLKDMDRKVGKDQRPTLHVMKKK